MPLLHLSQTRDYRKKVDVSHLKPQTFDYSEDLVTQQPLPSKEIMHKYRGIPDISKLPEHVQKLFTVEYATSTEIIEHRNAVLLENVEKVVGPGPCLEKNICYLTIKIRNLIPYLSIERRNKRHKSYLIERIAKRKKYLERLRSVDYNRFMWLLKELKISYTPYNKYSYYKMRKRAAVKTEVKQEYLNEKQRKIEEVKQKLEEEKEQFFQLKEKILKEIDNDIKEYGLDKVEILKQFAARMRARQLQRIEEAKKLTGIEKYAKEQKLKKEKESRVF